MLSLAIRTDNKTSELHLCRGGDKVDSRVWEAHRTLADTVNTKIMDLLDSNDVAMSDLDKIIVLKGPGSFTGLRIGLSVANALAYGLEIPIVGVSGDSWVEDGLVQDGAIGTPISPEYGREPHITQPRK